MIILLVFVVMISSFISFSFFSFFFFFWFCPSSSFLLSKQTVANINIINIM